MFKVIVRSFAVYLIFSEFQQPCISKMAISSKATYKNSGPRGKNSVYKNSFDCYVFKASMGLFGTFALYQQYCISNAAHRAARRSEI